MNKYQKLRLQGKLFGTIKRAVALREKRDSLKSKKVMDLAGRFNRIVELIPLGCYRSNSVDKIHEAHPRKQNWTSPKASFKTGLIINDLGKYSNRCKYTHYTYTPGIESFGRILNEKLFYHLDSKRYILKAPKGWKWSTDSNGIKLLKTKNSQIEYHPTAFELVERNNLRNICNKAKELYQQRKQAEKKLRLQRLTEEKNKKEFDKRIKTAIKSDCYVLLNDSLKSGNCLAGTQNWLTSHKLGVLNYVRLKDIISYIDESRVKLVILYAIKRHNESLKVGYSKLKD